MRGGRIHLGPAAESPSGPRGSRCRGPGGAAGAVPAPGHGSGGLGRWERLGVPSSSWVPTAGLSEWGNDVCVINEGARMLMKGL